ncbi:MAG: hypothetical protein RJA19_537 [Bacteroidota bacterium]
MGAVLFIPSKVNLGLFVTSRRNDGFHNLESIFLPTGWCDVMEIRVLDGHGRLELRTSGREIPGDQANNLVRKAYERVADRFPVPSLEVHLRKVVPMGAGLGGGSADGAWMLRWLRDALDIGAEPGFWEEVAAALGSDCPYFLSDGPAFVSGRGEHIERLPARALPLSGWHMAILHPGIHVSTQAAFAGITPRPAPFDLRTLSRLPVEQWSQHVFNDFEAGISRLHPEIAELRQRLTAAGAAFAQMTGTGSAVYGLFAPTTLPSVLYALVDTAPNGHFFTFP